MNRRFFVHRVNIKREKDTKTGRKKDRGYDVVHPNLECCMEPAASEEKESQIGRISQFDYLMSWGTEDVRVNDVVVWPEENDEEYIVSKIRRDRHRPFSRVRPYQVAELQSKAT